MDTTAPVQLVIGGRLCLDFVNTVSSWGEAQPREDLASADAVLRWGAQMGLLPERQLKALRAQAKAHPALAGRMLAEALRLRAALYRVFTADRPAEDDVAALQHAVRQAREAQRLLPGRPWRWQLEAAPDLRLPLLHVALSAAELLTSDERERVKACPLPEGGCGWLFLDQTKNRTRRWCSMAHCGARAKNRRFAAKARQSAGA
jgi:predicted RNA-binding Zn ribbon-like protein